MTYILGVDGGGSKTLAVVADDTGEILGVGRSGSANHQNLGLEAALEQISAAVLSAYAMAGLTQDGVAHAAYCIAGADLPEDFTLLRPALEGLRLAQRASLYNDIMAALRSGSDRTDVVVVGWGSGVNAFGRNAEGMEIRLPALGWISGDWGGGADLGREAVYLVARAHDGRGRQTALREPVLRALEASDVDDMIHTLYMREPEIPPMHTLAPLVFAAVESGDEVARELVERAGIEVATTAIALMRRLDLLSVPCDVVLAGSIFKANSALLEGTVAAYVHAVAPEAQICRPDVEPVLGALFLGFEANGVPVHAEQRERAKQSYSRLVERPEGGTA